MGLFNCSRCGVRAERHQVKRHANFCLACSNERTEETWRAILQVRKAVRQGSLPRAKDLNCVDCGKPAHDWEHRDYTEPLRVVPACRSCNLKRGPAFDSKYRPALAA